MLGNRLFIVYSVVLGVVGALAALLFEQLLESTQTVFLGWIGHYQPPGIPSLGGAREQAIGAYGLWLLPLSTTLGGLLSGLLVYALAPETEGHGTDTVVRAFHRTAGALRARVTPVKMVASAITIGSGGSAGREGPTALIAAGVGSIYGTLTRRSVKERRLLLLLGMAAGLSAIFRSPVGTAIFAIEVLYSDMDFDAGALIYTLLASVIAYAVNGLIVGWQPLFMVLGLAKPGFVDYLWYAVLGVFAGAVASLLPQIFYGMRDVFQRLPMPPHIKPAIGALGVGLIALQFPQVLGGGYGWIQAAIHGQLAPGLLVVLVAAKMLALSLTVSSGGSGGVFAPTLFVGAMLGSALGQLFRRPVASFAVVGMAAVFGAGARVPIATLLMVTEMTIGYALLVPAALAVTVSSIVQSVVSARLKYNSLYEAQVSSRTDSPAHHLEHLGAVLRLLSSHQIALPRGAIHLDLLALLESGIPLDLTEGKQLMISILRADSPWVDTKLSACRLEEDTEVVAIFREGHTLLASPNRKLKARDHLLLVSTPEARAKMSRHFDQRAGATAPQGTV